MYKLIKLKKITLIHKFHLLIMKEKINILRKQIMNSNSIDKNNKMIK